MEAGIGSPERQPVLNEWMIIKLGGTADQKSVPLGAVFYFIYLSLKIHIQLRKGFWQ